MSAGPDQIRQAECRQRLLRHGYRYQASGVGRIQTAKCFGLTETRPGTGAGFRTFRVNSDFADTVIGRDTPRNKRPSNMAGRWMPQVNRTTVSVRGASAVAAGDKHGYRAVIPLFSLGMAGSISQRFTKAVELLNTIHSKQALP